MANPPTSEPTTKSSMATSTVPFSPARRTIHALASMETVEEARFAVESHWASSCPMPKAPMMSGMATLMIVPESTAAMLPVTMVNIASHR